MMIQSLIVNLPFFLCVCLDCESDLSTLESNVDADVYPTLDDFARDCRKIFDNCRLYNGESTPYVKCANKLEKVFKDKLKEWKEA